MPFSAERGASANESAARTTTRTLASWWCLPPAMSICSLLLLQPEWMPHRRRLRPPGALYNKAHDQQTAGVVPAIDALRANVNFEPGSSSSLSSVMTMPNRSSSWRELSDSLPVRNSTSQIKLPMLRLLLWGLNRLCSGRIHRAATTYSGAASEGSEQFRRAATAEHLPSLDFAGNFWRCRSKRGQFMEF